jgi:hypothetical protein
MSGASRAFGIVAIGTRERLDMSSSASLGIYTMYTKREVVKAIQVNTPLKRLSCTSSSFTFSAPALLATVHTSQFVAPLLGGPARANR